MALDATNVAVAVTGAVYVAPAGTTIPNDPYDPLHANFADLGYMGEDGVVESHGTETNDIKAWQNGDVVRKVQTSHDLTYAFTMIETNPDTMEFFYGNYANGVTEITGEQPPELPMVIHVIDGTDLIRISIPAAQISERGDVQYVNGDAVGRPVTVTCYPDISGVKAYVYLGGSLSA